MYSLKVLFPVFSSNKTIYFRGYFHERDCSKYVIYVTKYSPNEAQMMESTDCDNVIRGRYSRDLTEIKNVKYKNYIHLNPDCSSYIQKLIINGVELKSWNNCVIMLYDYNKIKESQIISSSSDCNDYFSTLHNLIQKDNYGDGSMTSKENFAKSFIISKWLSSSMFAQHIFSYINLLNWLRMSIFRDKKVQIKQANYVFAIVIDLILGYILLNLLIQDKEELSIMLMDVLEKLVNSLYSLLKWLMGAPAGLKLNNAFNKMLGKYFSYHIQLWWLFLDVSGEKLDVILHIFQYLGYLGVTFQAAMICDMICIATFHSYCIYVYAARYTLLFKTEMISLVDLGGLCRFRLFNIQISGLIALLRLFVGRKYNPLRGGIDSCEYTNQELFVGTVAFTILLLLLPTTAMYYTVFTLFRILSLAVQYVLAKIIHLIQTLPLYVTILWLVGSPKVAGNILIDVVSTSDTAPLVLKVKVRTKPLSDLVQQFKPPVDMAKPVEWTNLVSNVLTGKQIV